MARPKEEVRQNKAMRSILRGETPEKRIMVGFESKDEKPTFYELNLSKIKETHAVSFFAYGICKNSFGPCAFEPGPNTPVITNCASGNFSPNIAIKGIEPPSPIDRAGLL